MNRTSREKKVRVIRMLLFEKFQPIVPVPSVLMQPVTSETLPTQETLEKIDLTVI